jgi:glucan-binding YG repeat protein
MNKQYSVYPREGAVVKGQSKVEKAKYVHTENNLRQTLENIAESFKRTNKRLSDETEAVRTELHKLKQSVEKVQQEKMKRMRGEHHKRRPYKAERFLCDENIVTLKPFNDSSSKIVTQRKSWAKKLSQRPRRLAPIMLHQNKLKGINDEEEIRANDKKEQQKSLVKWTKARQAAPFTLPKVEPCTNEKSGTTETGEKEISDQTFRSKKRIPSEENVSGGQNQHLQVPIIPVCDLKDIPARGRENIMKSRPHFLPALDKITEGKVAELRTVDHRNLVSDESDSKC